MERYQMLNKALQPMDFAIGLGFDVMKKARVFEPFCDTFSELTYKTLGRTFAKNHALEVVGIENVPTEGGVLLAANHQSWQDAQVISVASPRFIHYIAKSEFLDWPVLRRFFEIMQAVYISRNGDAAGLANIAEALRQGKAIGIFPEGTIPGEEDIPRWDVDRETGLLKGRTGAVRLALMTGAPIVPVGISGTGAAFPPEMFPRLQQLPLAKKVPITVTFGAPIHFGEKAESAITRDELRQKTDHLMRAISALVDHNRDYQPVALPIPAPKGADRLPPLPYKNQKKIRAKTGVLVLHGFTGHIHTVDELVPYLEKHEVPYRFPYLRGHGTQWEDLRGTTARDWYADAEAAMFDLMTECDEVILVGLSMGGAVALELAARHNDTTAAVIVIAPALRFADPLASLTPVMARVIKSWPGPKSYNDKACEKLHNKNYKRFTTDAFASLFDYTTEVTNLLSFVRAPLLVVAAKKDKVIAPKAAKLVYSKASSKEKDLLWFKRSGHEMLLDLEKDAVCQAIDDYIGAKLKVAS